jgi:hypothetical protein
VYRAFERRDVMLEVIALARKLTQRPGDRRVATLDKCAHGALHILRFLRTGDRPWHSEQRCVPSRDAFFVRDADLELDARVLLEVVQTREDRL